MVSEHDLEEAPRAVERGASEGQETRGATINPDVEATADRLALAVPAVMRPLKAWVLWKAVPDHGGRIRKVPHYAGGGKREGKQGDPQDRALLVDFETALQAFRESGGAFAGLGVALLPDVGLVAADFDDHHGRGLHPEAMELAAKTYAERSPGGLGVRAIWLGTEPSKKNNRLGVEVFGDSGFVTITGNRLTVLDPEPLPETVRNRLRALTAGESPRADITHAAYVDAQTVADLRSALRTLDPTDYDQWVNCGQRLKSLGDVGRGLWMDWGAMDRRFDERQAWEKWQGFRGTDSSYRGVFAAAQERGWLNPRSRAAQESGAGETSEPFMVSVGELLADKSPPAWLIHGHIEDSTITALIAPPESGKSFLLIDWALSIATGRRWQGQAVSAGGVAYLAGEGGGGFKRRCAAWAQHNKADITTAPLFFNRRIVQLMDAKSCAGASQAVASIVAKHGPVRLIVVDTLNRVGGGDESSNTDTAKILAHVEEYFVRPFGASVIFAHHPGHPTPGSEDRNRPRGASALPGGCDHMYGFTSSLLQCTKMKDGPKPAPLQFRLEQVTLADWPADPETGEPPTSCVLVPCESSKAHPKSKRLTPRLQAALDALARLLETDPVKDDPELRERFGLLAPSRAVGEAKWRAEFMASSAVEHDDLDDTKRTAFRRAKHDLIERGIVSGHNGLYWKGAMLHEPPEDGGLR
jgi:hypothetical protein